MFKDIFSVMLKYINLICIITVPKYLKTCGIVVAFWTPNEPMTDYNENKDRLEYYDLCKNFAFTVHTLCTVLP